MHSKDILQAFVHSMLLQSFTLFQQNVQLLFALDTAGRKCAVTRGICYVQTLMSSQQLAWQTSFFPCILEVGVADGYAHNTEMLTV